MKKLFFVAVGITVYYLFRKPLHQAVTRIAESCQANLEVDEIELSSQDSFPASDPPSYTGAHA
jgi:hypothetical protein